ncbi:alpha/beta fold hydrolase [Sphingomonas sanxanigenens]|uniref:AB hydrolase-1 domain-containing protein n=1 Tax=Sphingomonas sanxanigenens DSM 19645 = NX02 TaxID=1123269 RepID=W0A9S6_9SPHN|nr:alpha/beta hydrolase [Sphingomonas sanxanigenens]AHE53851.1 hypothetical protein NX02_10675 [Sphingomonas sanxanigenens DSM 19645 = NX02]
MAYVETRDGTELYVKEWGEGRPVILIHGWPLSADSWDDQSLALAEAGFRAIAYDRRGFGRSEQPAHGYDYDTLADDLADVMEAMDAEDGAAIVGFSMGGGEVARYMTRHEGAGVEQAALIAAVTPFLLQTGDNPDGAPASVFEEIKAGIKADRSGFFKGFMRDFYGVGALGAAVGSHEGLVEWSVQLAMQGGLLPTLACVDSWSSTDFRPDMGAFEVPTLVMHGTADATVPIALAARKAAAMIASSELIEIDGGPHGLLATHKDEVSAALIRFLRA